MSGLTEKEMEFIELVEKSYSKQRRNAFIEGTLFGILFGLLLALMIVLIF